MGGSDLVMVDPAVSFKLVRFNPRRQSRGAEAAEVEVFDDDHSCRLWMSEKNLDQNIAEFGPHPELLKAKEHYRTKREFPDRMNAKGRA